MSAELTFMLEKNCASEGLPRPGILEILKWLPKSNCRKCGEPTCLVFATRMAEGVKAAADCPDLPQEDRRGLDHYLGPFRFDA